MSSVSPPVRPPREALLATRSAGKRREIAAILAGVDGLRLLTLDEVGVAPDPEEDGIEAFETFAENAAAKAAHFRRRTGLPTIADDSGLVVDALGGRPGVRSRRFAPAGEGLEGEARDRENNRYLVELLRGVPDLRRTARYVCVAALDGWGAPPVHFEGASEGRITTAPRGEGGFGYDPYFLDPGTGRTYAQMTPEEKDSKSHRGKAFRKVAEYLARPLGDASAGALGGGGG